MRSRCHYSVEYCPNIFKTQPRCKEFHDQRTIIQLVELFNNMYFITNMLCANGGASLHIHTLDSFGAL
jgi:hypothetical protein